MTSIQPIPIWRELANDLDLKFTDHQVLHRFRLSNKCRSVHDGDEPPIIETPLEEIESKLKGKNLREGMDRIKLMGLNGRSYGGSFVVKKAQVMMDLIQSNDAFSFLLNPEEKLPFVANAGVFVNLLRVGTERDDYHFYAWKQDNFIRMVEGHNLEFGSKTNPRFQVQNRTPTNDRGSQCRLSFLRMLFSLDNEMIHEDNKCYKVTKVGFGNHTLVPLSEVHAVDKEGHDVKITMRTEPIRDSFWSDRFVELWAHARIADNKKIIVATRDRNILNNVHVMDSDTESMIEFMERLQSSGDDGNRFRMEQEKCAQMIDFLDRILTLIQEQIATTTAGKQGRVLKIAYNRNETARELVPIFLGSMNSRAVKDSDF